MMTEEVSDKRPMPDEELVEEEEEDWSAPGTSEVEDCSETRFHHGKLSGTGDRESPGSMLGDRRSEAGR